MTQTKHTPAPWNIAVGYSAQYHYITVPDVGVVAEVHKQSRNAEANARLIAAAPELLEALRDTCNTLYALRDHAIEQGLQASVEQMAIDKIIAAIAKAKGE